MRTLYETTIVTAIVLAAIALGIFCLTWIPDTWGLALFGIGLCALLATGAALLD